MRISLYFRRLILHAGFFITGRARWHTAISFFFDVWAFCCHGSPRRCEFYDCFTDDFRRTFSLPPPASRCWFQPCVISPTLFSVEQDVLHPRSAARHRRIIDTSAHRRPLAVRGFLHTPILAPLCTSATHCRHILLCFDDSTARAWARRATISIRRRHSDLLIAAASRPTYVRHFTHFSASMPRFTAAPPFIAS